MRSTSILSAASVASLASLASAQLDKPVIDPQFPEGALDEGLLDYLETPDFEWSSWDEGWIPEDCKSIVEGAGFSAEDIITFEITYSDCPNDPWVFCRHQDSDQDEDEIAELWGKLPVRMRGYVRHMVFLPGENSAGSSGDNVQMNGDLPITVYVHETAHSLDGHAFSEPFSPSQTWLDAYNADSAVTDSYGQTNQGENFAQQTVIALYDTIVEGGVSEIQPSWEAISHQFHAIIDNIGDVIVPDGECAERLENSAPVETSPSARKRPSQSTKPDVSLSKHIAKISPIPMGDAMQLTTFDHAGKALGRRTISLRK
ncbi:hypothetical protein ACO1O0_009185 [Amphichorda felina]